MVGCDWLKMFGRSKSSSPVSDPGALPRPHRRPPSTPPLPVRTLQLVAKRPETPVVLRDRRKVRGQRSGVRESWPGTKPTPPSAQPITEVQPRGCNQSHHMTLLSAPPPRHHWSISNRAPPTGPGSEATMMSLLLFCHSSSCNSLVAIDSKVERAMDLVKTHLMVTVREEAELLREAITELQKKNKELERENHNLRTHNYT
ncbi:uncharacterized protein LOC133950066 [Platichthys flesus]|uniref:uncharacterized protein LOC133950066 n=1 Tax=Platichthys flesus TaxID=8260 RepID=UPI002DBECDEB|nr:uncharacterized protein LOC133950066 [Platichthys flesus]